MKEAIQQYIEELDLKIERLRQERDSKPNNYEYYSTAIQLNCEVARELIELLEGEDKKPLIENRLSETV